MSSRAQRSTRAVLLSKALMAILLPLLPALTCLPGYAQVKRITGTVTNQFTLEKIPFASVVWKKEGKGTLTDSAGAFRLDAGKAGDTLVVSYVGFKDLELPARPSMLAGPLNLFLSEGKETGKVTITRTYNRGLLWWRRIVKNKPVNDPYKFDNYHCRLYNKLEFDINNISREGFNQIKLLRPFGFVLDNIDSVSENKPFLPVYMTESLSDFYLGQHPHRVKETITALQTTGIRNETVFQFIGGINQRLNCYDNFMVLFGKEFVSPLSNNGDNFYNYRGADTQFISGDRYLHLYFTPKRAGENTFSGDCWVQQRSWAVKKMNLAISPDAAINFVNRLSLVQEFSQQEDSSWICIKDKFIADISPLKKDKISIIVRKTALYTQVVVNDPATAAVLAAMKTPEQVTTSDSARLHPPQFWATARPEQLSVNEQKVYKMIDTLTSMPLFKKYTNTLEFITDGRKKLGKVEIGPWYKWISRNPLEGPRLRFDLATTEKFSKRLYLHGYLAYGFRDHALKGKAEFNYKFPGTGGYSVHASYTKDLDNGRAKYNDEEITTDNVFSQLIRRPNIRQKFMGIKELKFSATKEWGNGFSIQPFAIRTSYVTYAPLPHKDSLFASDDDITAGEIGLKLRFAPGEKKISTIRKDYRFKGNHPVFELRYVQGLNGFLDGQYNYEKLYGSITQKIRLHSWGSVQYRAYGGKIFSNALPFMLLELHPGNEVYYYSKDGFNLMNRFEFYSDEFAGINVEHDLGKKLLNLLPFLRKTSIRQFWNVKTVWGNLSTADRKLNHIDFGSYRLRTLNNHAYTEIGTGIDNIFRVFRVDLVWRFAPQATSPRNMPPPKISNSSSTFGIFGSFHFQL